CGARVLCRWERYPLPATHLKRAGRAGRRAAALRRRRAHHRPGTQARPGIPDTTTREPSPPAQTAKVNGIGHLTRYLPFPIRGAVASTPNRFRGNGAFDPGFAIPVPGRGGHHPGTRAGAFRGAGAITPKRGPGAQRGKWPALQTRYVGLAEVHLVAR